MLLQLIDGSAASQETAMLMLAKQVLSEPSPIAP